MPSLTSHGASNSIKMILVGDSGTGKTGALASLVKDGYKLFILDYDNGLDILTKLLTPAEAETVTYDTLQDQLVGQNFKSAEAFGKGINLLDKYSKLPSDKNVVVIDSLTFMAEAALRQAKSMDGKLNGRTEIQHYGWVNNSLGNMLHLITAATFGPHVIVNSHIDYVRGDGDNVFRGLPNAVGNKLPQKIPAYFNSVLQIRVKGSGASQRREILTRTEGLVELKSTLFSELPEVLPATTGLATFFNTYRKTK